MPLPSAPAPISAPEQHVSAALAPVPGPVVLPPPPPYEPDPIVHSRWARSTWISDRVRFWTDHWRGDGRRDFQIYLNRLERFRPMVEAEIELRGLPRSLLYLPIVESGYAAAAVSGARAVGLWQFMDYTARERGLRVNPILDERRDPVRATPEALEFLHELRERFGSWFLALAAYNGGPSRLSSILRREVPLAPLGDSLLIAVGRHLPPETREFVPKLIAAATLASAPERYGFAEPREIPVRFDEVTLTEAVSIDVIADLAGAAYEEIERLNPQLLRGFTPPDATTVVRVPAGSASGFHSRLEELPPEERLSFLEHRVEAGETFSHIARRYGVRLDTLRAANPGVQPRRLQIGQWVVVPSALRRPGS